MWRMGWFESAIESTFLGFCQVFHSFAVPSPYLQETQWQLQAIKILGEVVVLDLLFSAGLSLFYAISNSWKTRPLTSVPS